MTLEHARRVADAVLYEGYLLYPYRASSGKNQSRWQFGVLGPPGAAEAGCGEDSTLATQVVVRRLDRAVDPVISLHLRFLHLQKRSAQRLGETGTFEEVAELASGGHRWLTWDEAVDREVLVGPWPFHELTTTHVEQVVVPAGEDVELIQGEAGAEAGRLVRSRRSLHAELSVGAAAVTPELIRLSVRVENTTAGVAIEKGAAIAASFIGAHLLLVVEHGEFVSMTDPPGDATEVVAGCEQHRCWPVLAGPEGDQTLLLVSPIILYDHPELAPESAGALFDSTEIDEILTLRVMTLTDEEKAAARATDPRSAEIIDRCDAMSPEAMQQLHGVLRNPHAAADVDLTRSLGFDGEVPWWDPAVDAQVSPQTDEVVISGVRISAGSIVRVNPSRRADAQDLFFAGKTARVAAVHSDVDGKTHVAVILVDDPAADLHDWYGRYLYFAPDELEPLPPQLSPSTAAANPNREETQP